MIQFCRLSMLGILCVLLGGCAEYTAYAPQDSSKSQEVSAFDGVKSKADSAFAKGDYAEASSFYGKVLEQDPQNHDALFYSAESLRISGKSALALEQYNKLIAKDANNLAAIEGRGLCYLQQGDITRALGELNFVVEKDARRWRTLNALGVATSISGKSEEAMKYYNMALAESHNNPSVINNMALGVAFAGDSAQGISLLKGALAGMVEGEKKKTLENNLALIYGISGKMEEAEAILRKNLPEPAVYNNLGFYAKISSDKQLAWSYLSKAMSSSPVFYEKAQNNIQGLEGPAGNGNNLEMQQAEPQQAQQNDMKMAGLSKAEIAAMQSPSAASPKIAPVKAWRGKHKLPLPTLRPSIN